MVGGDSKDPGGICKVHVTVFRLNPHTDAYLMLSECTVRIQTIPSHVEDDGTGNN